MMRSMTVLAMALLTAAAGAQDFPQGPQEFLLAKAAAADGRYEEALEHIGRVLAKEPDDPILRFEKAMILIDAGSADKAERELRAVLQKSPAFYDANRVLGRLLLDRAGADREQVGEALVFLQAAFAANPDDLSTGVAVAQILRSLDRLPEAERVLATMVERAPDQRSLTFNYAQILTTLGRTSDAKQYLERTLALDPTFAPAVMPLLEIYQTGSEWQKAADVLQPLIEENPMSLELQRQQAYFHLRSGNSRGASERFRAILAVDPTDTRAQFYLAESLNDLEQYREAESMFRKLVAATPDDIDTVTGLGLSLAGQKKWDEATQTFTSLLSKPGLTDHVSALARTQLAYIDVQKQNYAAAVETAKSVLVFRDKPNTQAINIALDALKKQKKSEEAVALLEPLVKQFPDDPFVNARYVEALARAGRTDEARTTAAASAKLGTRNAIAVSEAWMQAGDEPAAIAILTNAIAAKPEELDLQFQLGAVYERAGDKKAAEKVFLQLLEKEPQHAPSLNYLGYMWAESGINLDRAHEMLTRAVGQEPDNGAYVDSLGWVYYRLGNLELAEKYLTDATRLLPRDATVHEHLADVLAKRGDMTRALELYRVALDLDPQSKDVEKIRSKIAAIESNESASRR